MNIPSLFICGFPETAPNKDLDALLQRRPAGFILFERNVSTHKSDLKALINHIRAFYKERELQTPVLAIDHEGGRVHRLKNHATRFPLPGEETLTEEKSFAIGKTQGEELKALGFNMVFAPVYDLGSKTEEATALGKRTFSSSPETCARLAEARRQGLESSGIIAIPKHFPGYGAVITDPHEDLPVVEKKQETLMQEDFVPFLAAIKNNCKSIMSAHILNKSIDDKFPSTLSERCGNILREKLHFKGCLISDDLCMCAIIKHYGVENFATLAVNASIDLQLLCHPLRENDWTAGLDTSIDAIRNTITDNSFSQKISQAINRVSTLRSQLV